MTVAPDLYAIYERSNQAVAHELDEQLPVIEGTVPPGLRGVLFRNGPGRLELYGHRYGHLFDGDGHINRFAFTDRGISYRNRYVRTREFLAEESARKILYRGFGTNIPGGLRKNLLHTRFKNAANTSVVHHAGRLLALWEAGWPHRIDPGTLDTLARDDLGGSLRNPGGLLERLIAPELPFSAHPKLCPTTGELYNFGLAAAGTGSRLCLYRISRDGAAAAPEFIDLPGGYFVHDFVLTARHRVFFLTPTTFDLPRMLLGLAAPVETFRALPGPTQILIVDRHGTQFRRATARACFIFHFPNGYDDEADDVVIADGYRMDGFPRYDRDFEAAARRPDFPRPYLTRYRIDLRRGTTDEQPLTEHPGELGGINLAYQTRRHRYVWQLAAPVGRPDPFSTGVARIDCEQRTTLFRDFAPELPGEPVFVPRPGATAEDDGWLLSMSYDDDAGTCHLRVLDARDLSTVCRARLPHSTPLGFHGAFIPAERLLA
jgi:all-trans-8'-apo-beta-carotenal 15,15'-oxygenase